MGTKYEVRDAVGAPSPYCTGASEQAEAPRQSSASQCGDVVRGKMWRGDSLSLAKWCSWTSWYTLHPPESASRTVIRSQGKRTPGPPLRHGSARRRFACPFITVPHGQSACASTEAVPASTSRCETAVVRICAPRRPCQSHRERRVHHIFLGISYAHLATLMFDRFSLCSPRRCSPEVWGRHHCLLLHLPRPLLEKM